MKIRDIKGGIREVTGQTVTIVGWEDFSFFLDERPGRSPAIRFVVSEVQSGCEVACGFSAEEAVEKAVAVLRKKGPDATRQKIQEKVLMHGKANA